jgi:streptomycin 6-kinase
MPDFLGDGVEMVDVRIDAELQNVVINGVDEAVRQKLISRFGIEVESWFDALPDVLAALAATWHIDLGAPIPRGSMSVVLRCRTEHHRPAVLKISPDRLRIATETRSLRQWKTDRTPTVLAADEHAGALLMEAIEPGTPLVVSGKQPAVEEVGELLTSLHATGDVGGSYPTVADRCRHLFASGAKPYERQPRLADVVPPLLYERGRRLAQQLTEGGLPTVLLHGDLTPSNLLDGGPERGLVAIDPAPCVGDAAFDAVDLLLWQAADVETIEARAERLAAATGYSADRLLAWCTAYAGMVALELAESSGASPRALETLTTLANRAPAVPRAPTGDLPGRRNTPSAPPTADPSDR